MRTVTARLLTRLFKSFAIFISLAALLGQAGLVFSQPIKADAGDWGADDSVTASAVQPDGKILIGGVFTQVAGHERPRIARLNPDGSQDESFKASSDYSPRGFLVLPDGKIVIYGIFAYPDSRPPRIDRLNPDGTLDNTFSPNMSGSVYDAVVQSDGKFVIAGNSLTFNGVACGPIARLNPDGSLDANFHPDGTVFTNENSRDEYIDQLIMQPDGMVLAVGNMPKLNSQPMRRLVRIQPDGTLDAAFQANIPGSLYSIVQLPDGKIFVGGSGVLSGGGYKDELIRLNTDGSRDITFSSGYQGGIFYLALLLDGGIIGSQGDDLFRLDRDGKVIWKYAPIANASIRTLLLVKEKILIGGLFTTVRGHSRNHIALLNLDGSLDRTFSPQVDPLDWGANDHVMASALQPDGKILIGGAFTLVGGREQPHIARLNPDGSVDRTFLGFSDDYPRGFRLLPDGKILVFGEFYELDGVTQRYVGRLNADGSLDRSFAPQVAGRVFSVMVQSDGKYVIAGKFWQVNGQPRIRIARLNPDGRIDPDFHPDADDTYYSYIDQLIQQPDGKILVSGTMTQINGQPVKPIVRLNADGSLDSTFQADDAAGVGAMALLPDGKILAGNGSTRTLIRLNADGSRDTTFTDFTEYWNSRLAPMPDGGVIVSVMYAGNLFRLDRDGKVDTTFSPSTNNSVFSLLLLKDKILIGGLFTQVNGQPRNHIALLNLDGSLVESFNPGPQYEMYLPSVMQNN